MVLQSTATRRCFFWSDGETLAAFRREVQVHPLATLKFDAQSRVDTWRRVERFEVIDATEHGPCSLLVFNQHQPSSNQRPFKSRQRNSFCKEVLSDAIRFQTSTPRCLGFGFGGDANCSTTHWSPAFSEMPENRVTMQTPQLPKGVGGGTMGTSWSVAVSLA